MKTIFVSLAAGLLAISFAASADAATKHKRQASAQHEASCKAQAAKKFSAIHFIKRRDFVNNCMGRTARGKTLTHAKAASTAKKPEPTTTGQR